MGCGKNPLAETRDEAWLVEIRKPSSPGKTFEDATRERRARTPCRSLNRSVSGGLSSTSSPLQRATSGSALQRSGSRSRSPEKRLTLCAAVRAGSTQNVARLLSESRGKLDINGEEVNTAGQACTPLTEAIRTNNLDMTRLLLDFDALPTHALSDSGATPLALAAASADGDIISMLMQKQNLIRRNDAKKWSLSFHDTQRTRRPDPFGADCGTDARTWR